MCSTRTVQRFLFAGYCFISSFDSDILVYFNVCYKCYQINLPKTVRKVSRRNEEVLERNKKKSHSNRIITNSALMEKQSEN